MEGQQPRRSKGRWNILALICLMYLITYLDRVNIGFAGATMRADLNLSATAFGGAAGIFFIAYFFFEVPSNLAWNAFGARRWIAFKARLLGTSKKK